MASVIVLTYNQQAYIGQALDSILMQKTRFPYEILVGDDASIDKTGSIVRSYAQAYPQTSGPIQKNWSYKLISWKTIRNIPAVHITRGS